MLNNARRRRRHRGHNNQTKKKSNDNFSIAYTNNSSKTKSSMDTDQSNNNDNHPAMSWVMVNAVLYVLSGVTQPILMAYAQHAGLADPRCQLYMLFYYIGPASVAVTMRRRRRRRRIATPTATDNDAEKDELLGGISINNGYSAGAVDGTTTSSYGATICNKPAPGTVATSYNGNVSSGGSQVNYDGYKYEKEDEERRWPSQPLLIKASSIALFDIFAQSMTFTGNNMAGPTIFSIIYSSVTIWAALYSKLLLSRSLSKPQWMGVCLVVVGLSLTAMDSLAVGASVFMGACLILVGSSFHGLTYVLSEKIMTAPPPALQEVARSQQCNNNGMSSSSDGTASTTTTSQIQNMSNKRLGGVKVEPQHISVRANCSIQGIVATLALLLWQLIYTLPRLKPLILDPMAVAGTSNMEALLILGTIALANLLHSVTFFYTLAYFPGGATSAGVLKGLQAVLVFAASSIVLCGRWGGIEMCWTSSKGVSLFVVVMGILLYGTSTEKKKSCSNQGVGVKKDSIRGLSMRHDSVDAVSGHNGHGGKIMCV